MLEGLGRRSSSWQLPLLALAVDLAAVAFVQPSVALRDERVFFPAAQAFQGAGWLPSLELLRSYPAPQTPLAFYLAGRVLALWPSLWLLRVGNALLMAGALWRFSRFISGVNPKNALLASGLLAVNPYYHLVATHFYSDALYFFLVMLLVTRAPGGRPWLSLTLLPLTRQFGLSFAIGEALQSFIERRFRAALAALVTLLPVLALFAWWRGVLPDTPNAETLRAVHVTFGWVFPYVTAYHLAALGFYAAPVAFRIERSRRFGIGALVGAGLSLAAPAHRNFASQLADPTNETLGLLHRASLLLGEHGSRALLCSCAAVGGGLVAEALFVSSAFRWFIALFLAFSAANFQAWDKYVLEALPSLMLALLTMPISRSSRRS